MKLLVLLFTITCCYTGFANARSTINLANDTPLIIRRCVDFIISGKGDNAEWQKANWVALAQITQPGKQLETKIKVLYSSSGIYVLFSSQDQKITSTFRNDFENLFEGDVVEVFFHPVPAEPIYFEYEISPLNKELVLLISNRSGKFGAWIPWHYDANKVVKKVTVVGGKMSHGSPIREWTAELFFPYALLNLFDKVPPNSGTRWNANFCRLDYDTGDKVKWSWSPIKLTFHEFKKYYPVQFE